MEQENLYLNTEKAEEYIIKSCQEMEGDQEALYDAAAFYMRRGEAQAEKAEEYLRDAYSFGMKNQSIALIYACLLMQNGRSKEAIVILQSLSQQGYEATKVNLLISIAYGMEKNPQLQEKFKAIALIEYMRQKEKIPELGSTKSRAPGSHPVEKLESDEASQQEGDGNATPEEVEKTNDLAAYPAYKNVRLT